MRITSLAEVIVTFIHGVIAIQHGIPANTDPKKSSGYLTLYNDLTGIPELIVSVGNIPQEKKEKYLQLSVEKAERLHAHHEHVSSFQSRNGIDKWGGSIRVEWEEDEDVYKYIFSFSGLTEAMDEAVMLYVAEKLGLMNDPLLDNIVEASNNDCYRQLVALEN
jgi:hypothetical protein